MELSCQYSVNASSLPSSVSLTCARKICIDVCLYNRLSGLLVAWLWRQQSREEFLAANRTQKGQIQRPLMIENVHMATRNLDLLESCTVRLDSLADDYTAIPLALNFIASGECNWITHQLRRRSNSIAPTQWHHSLHPSGTAL